MATQSRAVAAPTPEPILQLGLAFWGSKTLLSAVELDLFTELARGPLTAEQVCTRLGLHSRGARDFLDALVALGMLERANGYYANTAVTGRFLDRTKPEYVGGFLQMINRRLYGFWGSLTEALRTGRPQNEAKHDPEMFGTLYTDTERLRLFLGAMTGLSSGVARAMARKFPWSECRSFADIGAAQGGFSVALALAHPHLTGVGYDLPQVRPVFEDYVASHRLSERVRFHAGDFLREPLPRAEVLVMGHILHDWDLDQKRMLIAKSYESLPPGGALIAYDCIIDDERCANAVGLLMSLNMLIETSGGSDYSGAECVGWMRDAGFREARVEHLMGPESMVVGIK